VSHFLREKSGSQGSSKAQAVTCVGGLLYGVRAGETFISIARKFDVPLSDLMEANPGVDTMRVGMILCIPGVSGRICTSGGLAAGSAFGQQRDWSSPRMSWASTCRTSSGLESSYICPHASLALAIDGALRSNQGSWGHHGLLWYRRLLPVEGHRRGKRWA